jgi:hypothetical protein
VVDFEVRSSNKNRVVRSHVMREKGSCVRGLGILPGKEIIVSED